MTLKQKILLGYGIICALMCVIVAWTILNHVFLRKSTEDILQENYRRITTAGKIVEALERQNNAILMIILGDVETGASKFQKNDSEIDSLFGVARESVHLQGEEEIYESMVAYYEDYSKEFPSVIALTVINEPSHSQLLFYTQTVYPLFLRVRDRAIKLRDLNETAMYEASLQSRNLAGRALWSTVVVAALGLILVLTLSLVLAARIVRPIRELMTAYRKISEGDYGVQVRVDSKDELGSLGGEFNKMARQLRHFRDINIENVIIEKNRNDGIISSIDDGLVVFDTSLRVTGINPAARRILEVDRPEISDLKCSDIIPAENVCELIQKTIEAGVKPKDIPDDQRIIMLQRDGKAYHYLFSISVTKGMEGNLSGVVLLLRDVTRLKEAENFKNDFVMAASHELRTPLTSMSMSIDLLLEHVAPKLEAKDKDLIRTAHEEIKRMKALINDLLDLSRMESGKIELDLENIDVSAVFDQMKDVFRKQIGVKNVNIRSEAPEGLPVVKADENKIM